jgi:hypothetical protein
VITYAHALIARQLADVIAYRSKTLHLVCAEQLPKVYSPVSPLSPCTIQVQAVLGTFLLICAQLGPIFLFVLVQQGYSPP